MKIRFYIDKATFIIKAENLKIIFDKLKEMIIDISIITKIEAI